METSILSEIEEIEAEMEQCRARYEAAKKDMEEKCNAVSQKRKTHKKTLRISSLTIDRKRWEYDKPSLKIS